MEENTVRTARSKIVRVYSKRPYSTMVHEVTVWSFVLTVIQKWFNRAIKVRAILSSSDVVSGFGLGLYSSKMRHSGWLKALVIGLAEESRAEATDDLVAQGNRLDNRLATGAQLFTQGEADRHRGDAGMGV